MKDIKAAQVPRSDLMAAEHLGGRARARRRLGRILIAAGLLAGLLGIALPTGHLAQTRPLRAASTGGVPPGSVGNENLSINLTDQPSFEPNSLTIAPDTEVFFNFTNVGRFNHSFTLLSTPNVVASRNLTPSQLYQFLRTNGTTANVSVAPGATVTANITFSSIHQGDRFEFLSAVPYQFQAGMFGFLSIAASATGPAQVGQVNTTDTLRFDPGILFVNTSQNTFPVAVDLLVTNLGFDGHTFTLAGQANVSLTSGNFSGYFVAHAPLANVSISSGSGSSAWANFTVPAAGVYEFVCEISGHFANGMFGFLYVGVSPPMPPQLPSTAIVQPGVLLGGGILLVVGLSLTVAASYSGRLGSAPSSGTKSEHH